MDVEVEMKNDGEDLKGTLVVVEDKKQDEVKDKEEVKVEETSAAPPSSDLFSYTDKDFTSEIFKIELRNLPRYCDHGQFMTFLRKTGIKFSKVKVIPAKAYKGEKNSHAYVTLRSEEDRISTISKLGGLKYRGCEMSVSESAPLPDPLLMKRKVGEDNGNNSNKRSENGSFSEDGDNNSRKRARKSENQNKVSKSTIDDNFEQLPKEKRDALVNAQVASLWDVPYEQQLTTKASLLQKVLQKDCFYELLKAVKSLPKEAENRKVVEPSLEFFKNVSLTAESVLPSPTTLGYRNKCEFNVDAGLNVGFRLGQYKEGTMRVVRPPASCPLVSSQMQTIIDHFEAFIGKIKKKGSGEGGIQLTGFNPLTHEGHWRQILVRTTRTGEVLLSVALHQQELTEEQIQTEVIEPLKEHFLQDEGKNNLCNSLYIQVIKDRCSQVGSSNSTSTLIAGTSHVYETLFEGPKSLRFRISPLSFFQVNTPAAELLYSRIVELASVNPETVVLDVCCGTGTIGLALARSAKKVIGVELSEDAIEDARFNAKLNDITNVEYHAGRAEALIGSVLEGLYREKEEDVVAVLDPPRNGLGTSLIKTVRNNERIKRVVYVACDAKMARQNFIDLCRPKSKAYFGRPFVPVSATAVDLFPHTDRYELILLFERSKSTETPKA